MLLTNETPLLRSVLIGGSVAGVIDVFAASIINHADPRVILQAIASGALGRGSFTGGATTMLIGLVLQVLMGIIIAAIFLTAATRIALLRMPVLSGVLYGIGVYGMMTYVVVPLSRAKGRLPATFTAALPDLVAMIVFGLVIAFTPAVLGYVNRAGR